jgi:hypothetical protein
MSELDKYIGCYFNEIIKTEIEDKFKPYRVTICDFNNFNLEDFWENQIRCVVMDGKIYKLKIN